MPEIRQIGESEGDANSDRATRGVKVEERLIPLPRSVSPEASAYMASLVRGDGSLRSRPMSLPPIDDGDAWRKVREAGNARLLAMLASLSVPSQVRVDTIELGGVRIHCAAGPAEPEFAYLYMHGGAFIWGDGDFCKSDACVQAEYLGGSCYAVDYRLPPDHPFPAALDDCVYAYGALLDRYPPDRIIVGGQSAGGNLAAAAMLRARDMGLPLPAGLILLTPELDLTESGDSFETEQHLDLVLPGSLMAANLVYAAGHPLSDPYLSPLFGDFTKGFPPTFLQAGTRDLFLSNAVRMQRALRGVGVSVNLQLFEGMPHGGFPRSPEEGELFREMRHFVAECIDPPGARARSP